jgi:putative transposase
MEREAPTARLEAQIAEWLNDGRPLGEMLAELGRLGARLVLQRAVDEEVAAFLGRARYERTPAAAGSRNDTRPRPIQTAEGEITVDMPQVRGTAERFISRVFPDSRTVVRTRPLEALIIGGYVRGLSDRDIESLMQEAGLGHVSKSTASRICREQRDRYAAFCARSLAEIDLLAIFLDAIYLPTRPSGAK